MAIKKHLVSYLLALCIILLPVLNASAMSVEHSAVMPMNCLDYDPVEMKLDNPCEDQDCNSIAQSCGSHTSANYLPPPPLVEHVPEVQFNCLSRYDSDCRQGVTDQIYRPPIA